MFPLLRHLGSGAFGNVWKAQTPPNYAFYQEHPFVAIKIVAHPFRNALTEAETLQELDHEGCIKLLHCFLEPPAGNLFLIQEFCDLGDLSSETGSWPEHEVWKLVRQLSSAFEYIHSLGIIHRDEKPGRGLIECLYGRWSVTDKASD